MAHDEARHPRPEALPSVVELFNTALQHHQNGHLVQAEAIYRRILATDPNHLGSLNFLGVAAHQSGRHQEAVDIIGKAIALNDRLPDCHNSMGESLRALGRLDEAIVHFNRAIALEPDFAEAHNNLGSALAATDKLAAAIAAYRRVLEIQPDLIQTHNNLGNALRKQGKFDEAAAAYRGALALKADHADARNNLGLVLQAQGKLEAAAAQFAETIGHTPHHAEAHNNLGNVLRNQGKLDEAAARFRQALALRPDFVQAICNLGNALRDEGRLGEAAAQFRYALTLKPNFAEALHGLGTVLLLQGDAAQAVGVAHRALVIEETQQAKTLFVQALKSTAAIPAIDDLGDLLVRAMSEEPWGRPIELGAVSATLVKRNPAVASLIERIADARPSRLSPKDPAVADLGPIFRDKLLHCLLISAPVWDAELEGLLTTMRLILLEAASSASSSNTPPTDMLSFYCALARQCFINEYVFSQAEDEVDEVRRLQQLVTAALNTGDSPAVLWLVALATYAPLHSISGVDALLQRAWPAPVADLLEQQVQNPQAERQDQASIRRLTEIEDRVSRLVRQQYEENPYPRWVKAAPAPPANIDEYMRDQFPLSSVHPLGKEDIDVLIAGCGTGQHAVETAQRLPKARVLAVDLSLASLAYARRQARAAGLSNLQFGQADILKLGSLGQSFDVIEASGVLHHLAQPMAGLRVLHSLLRPNGLLRLGLYSALARTNIVAARAFIAERGYHPLADDIRRCRQELLAFEKETPERSATESPDFFSTSACRDLLFHVQEHRLTLPEIKVFLADLGLKCLGFDHHPFVIEKYRQRFPADKALNDLDSWHLFETENPRTFGIMYQFWTQKGW